MGDIGPQNLHHWQEVGASKGLGMDQGREGIVLTSSHACWILSLLPPFILDLPPEVLQMYASKRDGVGLRRPIRDQVAYGKGPLPACPMQCTLQQWCCTLSARQETGLICFRFSASNFIFGNIQSSH